jgi:hypothetical protein
VTENTLNSVGSLRIIGIQQSQNRGRDCAPNCLSPSLQLNPTNYHVLGYERAMVYARKLKKRENYFDEFSATTDVFLH